MRELLPCYSVISTEGNSEVDLLMDEKLKRFMEKNIPIESEAELRRREIVLSELTQIFRDWVKFVCISKGVPNEIAADAGGEIYTSGSYRLGIHEPGADIDTVCVAPSHCAREDFFQTLSKILSEHPKVTNLVSIETASVPILTFDFDHVNIDLLFATLPLNSIPESLDIDDDNILHGVDHATEKSLNGPRVTNLISKLVPNFNSFLITVRCVRVWAKKRGIYSNKLGYLGGVNFNILVAMVCQLYPNASPSSILNKFFFVYSDWKWPNPIQLCKPFDAGLGFEVWDPYNNKNDYRHVMPIITPAYPSMNSAVNVSTNTLEIMMEEFREAKDIVEEIVRNGGENWGELFQPSDFFVKYAHYLVVNISTKLIEELNGWVGYVESKMRKLVEALSSLPLSRVHLFPQKFHSCTFSSEVTNCIVYFIGFEIDKQRLEGKNLELEHVIQSFKESVYRRYTKLSEGHNIYLEHYTWKKLPDFVFESIGGKKIAKNFKKNRVKVQQKSREAPALHPTISENSEQQTIQEKNKPINILPNQLINPKPPKTSLALINEFKTDDTHHGQKRKRSHDESFSSLSPTIGAVRSPDSYKSSPPFSSRNSLNLVSPTSLAHLGHEFALPPIKKKKRLQVAPTIKELSSNFPAWETQLLKPTQTSSQRWSILF